MRKIKDSNKPRHITHASLDQDIEKILKKFFQVNEKIEHENVNDLEKNTTVVKLVTIFEQFCRKMMEKQIDLHKNIKLPKTLTLRRDIFGQIESGIIFYEKCLNYYSNEKFMKLNNNEITVCVKDLIKIDKSFTIGFLISLQHTFQNINDIIGFFHVCNIKNIESIVDMDQLKNLFDTRHDLIHTINHDNLYDIKIGCSTVRRLIVSISNSLFGFGFFDLQYGSWLMSINQKDKAIIYFDKVIELSEHMISASYNKFVILKTRKKKFGGVFHNTIYMQNNLARAYLNKANALAGRIHQNHVERYIQKSIAYADSNIKLCENYVKMDIRILLQFCDAYISKAVGLINLDRFDEAAICLDNCIALNQTITEKNTIISNVGEFSLFAYIYELKAMTLKSLENIDNGYYYKIAIDYYNKILKLRPEYIKYHYKKAKTLCILKKYNDAITDFQLIVSIDETHINSYIECAKIYSIKKNHVEAIEYFDKAIKIDKNNFKIYYYKGNHFFYDKNFDEAIVCFKFALKLNSTHFDSYIKIISCYEHIKKYDLALECYDRLLEIFPHEIILIKNKGLLLSLLSKYDEAIQCYNEIIKLCTDDDIHDMFMAYCYKGDSLCKLDKYDEAIECYNCATLIDPYDKSVVIKKAKACYEAKNYDNAIMYCKEIINSTDVTLDIDNAHKYMGHSHYMNNDYDNAMKCYEKALKSDIDDTNILINMSNILLKNKNYDDAIKYLDQVISKINSSS